MVDEQLKQRLVGAAVVISLGVIFFPMILDGGRHTEFAKIRIEIPQQPDVNYSSSIEPLARPEVRLRKPEEVMSTPDIDDIEAQGLAPILDDELTELIKPIEAPEEIVSKQGVDVRKSTVVVTKKPTTTKKPITTNKTVPKLEKPKKPVAKAQVPAPTPILPLPGPSAVSAWVVQVGSFSSRESAIGLRDKLRKRGFAAFVESFVKKGKASHRVRIGPETMRSRSEVTLASLKKKMQLEGIVVTYP